jgi:hypothetical protein
MAQRQQLFCALWLAVAALTHRDLAYVHITQSSLHTHRLVQLRLRSPGADDPVHCALPRPYSALGGIYT